MRAARQDHLDVWPLASAPKL